MLGPSGLDFAAQIQTGSRDVGCQGQGQNRSSALIWPGRFLQLKGVRGKVLFRKKLSRTRVFGNIAQPALKVAVQASSQRLDLKPGPDLLMIEAVVHPLGADTGR